MKIKLKGIVALMTMFCVFGSKPSSTLSLDSSAQAKKVNDQEEHIEVVSYESVLQSYYDLAVGDSLEPTESFDEFFDSFYAEGSDRDLYRFTLSLALDNGNYEDVYKTLYPNDNGIVTYSSSSSGGKDLGGGKYGKDASYVLTDSTDYSYTFSSCFFRQPAYSVYNYSSLKVGDIVWETSTAFFNTGHNALIVDTQHSSFYGNYIQTIEAIGGGVSRAFLDDYRMSYYKCKILRVVGRTDENALKAINFAKAQVGKPYNLDIRRLNTSIDSESWYCSELVYAAWKYAGIDIGVKDGKYLQLGCLPSDINNSDNTYPLAMADYEYLELSVVGKAKGVWSIAIYNPSSVKLTVEYNAKMSLLADSKDWGKLSDLVSIDIDGRRSVTVQISENWLCTSITSSYEFGDYRVVTYADNLDSKTRTLKQYQHIIKK